MLKTRNKFNTYLKSARPSNFVVDLKEQLLEAEKLQEQKDKKSRGLGIEDLYEKYEEFNVKEYLKNGEKKASDKIKTSTKVFNKVSPDKKVSLVGGFRPPNATPLKKNFLTGFTSDFIKGFIFNGVKNKIEKPSPAPPNWRVRRARVKKLAQTKVDSKNIKKTVSSIVKNAQPITSHSAHHDTKIVPKSLFLLSNFLPSIKNSLLIYRERLNSLAVFSAFKFLFFIFKPIYRIIYKVCYRIGWTIVFLVRLIYFSGLAVVKLLKEAGKLLKSYLIIFIHATRSVVIGLFKNIRIVVLEQLKEAIESRRQTRSLRDPTASALLRNSIGRVDSSSAPPSRMTVAENINEEEAHIIKNDEVEEIKPGKLIPQLSINNLKPVFAFAAILLLLIIPFKAFTYYKSLDLGSLKGKVLGATEEAVDNLLSAGQEASEMDFTEAQKNFSQAADQFLKAQNELAGINDILLALASIVPSEDVRLASESKDILAAGEAAAELGNNLSLAINSLLGNREENTSIGEILENFIQHGEKALVNTRELESILNKINASNIPDEYKDNFILAQEKAIFLRKSLDEFIDLTRKVRVFFGAGEYRRYLIVFQNNAELRATGGFIGSFALMDFSDGRIKNIEVPTGGSYDTEGGLKERIIAPEPLHLVNPLWHFWDANWWPDWPTSARKLMWFYERSGGPTVDGVIGITPTVLERILKVIGPIDMTEKYGVTITAENFWDTTRGIIVKDNEIFIDSQASSTLSTTEKSSSAKAAVDKPKTIIGDLTKKIIDEFPTRLNKEVLISLMKEVEASLNEKHILFYFTDSQLQEKIEEYDWDGKIKNTSRDYLSVVNTNIAGGKSDRKIEETIHHETQVLPDGSFINSVRIIRRHTGLKFEDSSGVRNVNWMRIYVPLGSNLIEARGFEKPDDIYFEKPDDSWQEDSDVLKSEGNARIEEASGTKIYEESGKTVFANWSMVDPGQTSVINLKYQLPFKLEDKEAYTIAEKFEQLLNPAQEELYIYSLLAQKQSGSNPSEINSSLKLPENINILWHYPRELNVIKDGWKIIDELDIDKYWAAVLIK